MVTTVIIVRHCQSMGNTEGRFQGRFDADVTPVGEQQMELLSLRFRNEKLDALYTSPLQLDVTLLFTPGGRTITPGLAL